MQSQQLLTESHVFKDKVLPRSESADHPPKEMPKRQDHGKKSYRKSPNRALSQIIHFVDVRRLGEAHPSELDNPDNRVLLALFRFSEMWVAEFFALPFQRAQGQGRELPGATRSEPGPPAL